MIRVHFVLGQRPYNNNSLLSDSILSEEQQEQLLNDIRNVPLPDLNLTQVSEPVDDIFPLTENTTEEHFAVDENSINSINSSTSVCISKPDIPAANSVTAKKTISRKKKRISDSK